MALAVFCSTNRRGRVDVVGDPGIWTLFMRYSVSKLTQEVFFYGVLKCIGCGTVNDIKRTLGVCRYT